MESEARIYQAKKAIRTILGAGGKRHSRIHDEAKELNTDRLRALEGKCGNCKLLDLNFVHLEGRDRVVLRCNAGLSPLTLYQNTPFGQEADCSKFEQK